MPERPPGPAFSRASSRQRGVGLALGAALLFSFSTPFAKLLLGETSPQLLAGLLYLGSGVGLSLLWLMRRRTMSREAPLTARDLPWLVGAIGFGGIVGPLLLMLGLVHTTASAASLLLNLEAVFTALLAWFAFHENFDARIALGMLAIVAGGIVLSRESRMDWGGIAGPLAIAGACLAWAVDNNLTQKVSGGDPVEVAMLKGLVAGAVNTGLAVLLGARWPGRLALAGALLLGLVSYGMSLTLFVLALRNLGTARTSAYFSVAPFMAAALSLIIFRERPSGAFLASAAFMAIGVWLHLTERHVHAHRHEAMTHEHAHIHDAHHQHAHTLRDPPVTDPVPHLHAHDHAPIAHTHAHYPDIHHRHGHGTRN